jgi:hypothetical protein
VRKNDKGEAEFKKKSKNNIEEAELLKKVRSLSGFSS